MTRDISTLAEFAPSTAPVRRFAARARDRYDRVLLAQPVTVPYARFSSASAHAFIGEALRRLIAEAGISKSDVDGLALSSFTLRPDTAIGLTQHLGVSPRYLDDAPFGGAGAVIALRRAARAVQAGDVDIVAVIAGDTNHVDSFRRQLPNFSRFAQDSSYPYGAGGPNAVFALIMDHYMRRFGARREDFGAIAVAQRANAQCNPNALLRAPMSIEDYLGARPISPPVHLYDCVMPCAGAEAFLVLRDDIARDLGLRGARIRATIERHNAFPEEAVQIRGGWAIDIDEFWASAGLSPTDVDVVETYDDYPVIAMMQLEDLGFCSKGEGPEFVRSHDLRWSGNFPHNTSGGQLSVGQAGAAGGALGLVEALRQVTGSAGERQVRGARYAVVSGFGMVVYDRGLASAAVLLESIAG
jgi:acetyl-CoA acetyltransferase